MTTRAARIGLWLAAAFVVLVLGSWMLLPLFVSSEFVRTAIERELADITGQQIRVGGKVDLDLFPSPLARVYDLHVPRDPDSAGNPRPDFLVVDQVEVAIPISSLLAREPAFSQFRLIRPTMRIAMDRDNQIDASEMGGRLGRAIAKLQTKTDQTQAGENGTFNDDATLRHLRFGTVTIENGTVEFVGTSEETPDTITAVNGSVSWPRLTERLSASVKGIWRGTAFEQKVDIDNAIHFFAGQITDVRLGLTSDALTYAFDGKMSAGPTPFVEGAVTMNTPSLRQALEWLQVGIQPGSSVGNVGLKATIRGDARKIRFENLELAFQGGSGMGVLELAFKDNAKPAMTATLDFQQMDILSFLSAFAGFPGVTDDFDVPVSPSFLDQLDVDLRLSAANAKAGALQFTNIAAVTQIKNDSAVFEMPDATAYGGKVQAKLKIARDKGVLTASFGVTGTDINSAAVADALAVGGLFPRGPTSGNLNVTAPLENWSDLFKHATGKTEIRITNGLINGVGFQTLGGNSEPQTFFRLQDNAQTSDVFSTMNIDAIVKDGVIIIDGGTIEYPDGTVQLNGVIPYGTASIALTTIAEPRADGDAPVIQHFIGGSWSNPYATPVLLPHSAQ